MITQAKPKAKNSRKFKEVEASGALRGPITWFRDSDNERLQVGHCRLVIYCPYCNEKNVHGWRLDGEVRTERRVAHCGCEAYLVRPAVEGESWFHLHQFKADERMVRKCRRRAGS